MFYLEKASATCAAQLRVCTLGHTRRLSAAKLLEERAEIG